MKLRKALFSLFSLTLLSLGGWLSILLNVDPSQADRFILVALYCSLLVFISAITTAILFGLRILLSNREIIFAHFGPSLRQGSLVGFTVVGLLFLQSLRVLSLIDAGAFILAVILIELFFRTKPKHYHNTVIDGDEQ